MSVTEIRVFPVSSTVLMRSALFALANIGAKLQAYNEETGVIVATVSRWMGLQKQEVVVRVRPLDANCQMELDAPDIDKTRELLQLINTYVRDGARVQANATMQWIDLARQQENRARRQQLTGKARSALSGGQANLPAVVDSSESNALAVSETGAIQTVDATLTGPVPIPDNPGVLVKNRNNMLVELKVDPEVFIDRSAFLVACTVCQTTTLRGSAYCPNCGRPLTLEAIQPDLRNSVQRSAGAALTYGLLGLAFNVVPALILVLPALLEPSEASLLEQIRQALSPLTIALAVALGLLPAIVAGMAALRQGQRASWYLNLPAVITQGGRGKASAGTALGWLSIYLAIAWALLIVIALL